MQFTGETLWFFWLVITSWSKSQLSANFLHLKVTFRIYFMWKLFNFIFWRMFSLDIEFVFFLSSWTLKMSFHYLLASIVSGKKLAIILTIVLMYKMCLSIFYFWSPLTSILTVMCLRVVFFGFILLRVCDVLTVCLMKFDKFLAILFFQVHFLPSFVPVSSPFGTLFTYMLNDFILFYRKLWLCRLIFPSSFSLW